MLKPHAIDKTAKEKGGQIPTATWYGLPEISISLQQAAAQTATNETRFSASFPEAQNAVVFIKSGEL